MSEPDPIDPEHRYDPEAAIRAVTVLNRALAADPGAIAELMRCQTAANEHLAADPTIQVGPRFGADNRPEHSGFDDDGRPSGEWVVRPLGLINGIIGIDTDYFGVVAAEWDGDDKSRPPDRFFYRPARTGASR